MKKNNGFTLIEIIVSLAITIAVLSSVLLIALNVTDVFNNTSDMANLKTSVDKISEYVRDQLEYSTEVTMSKAGTAPTSDSDWHYLYVKDGMLYRDGESVYTAGYYSGKSLNITFVGYYKSKSRMDLTYTLGTGSDSYEKKDTLKLVNLNLSSENVTYPDTDATYYLDIDSSNNGGKYLYYRNNSTVNIKTNSSSATTDGTVADKIYLMTAHLNRGYFKTDFSIFTISYPYHYNSGQYVFYNGYWWLKVSNTNDDRIPGSDETWQRLSPYYDSGVNSGYEKGDIVIYNNEYYQWNQSYLFNSYGKDLSDHIHDWEWKKIDKPTTSSYTITGSDIKAPAGSPVYKRPSSIKIYDTDSSEIEEWSSTGSYAVGSFVKVKTNMGDNGVPYYQFYKKVFSTSLNYKPGVTTDYVYARSGWELLENEYTPYSSYTNGDVVSMPLTSVNGYYKCNYNLFSTTDMQILKETLAANNTKSWVTYTASDYSNGIMAYNALLCYNNSGSDDNKYLNTLIWTTTTASSN